MRLSLLLSIIVLSASPAKSQEFFLGKTKAFITDSLAKLYYYPDRIGEIVPNQPDGPIRAMRPNADSDRSRENAGLLAFSYSNFNYYDTRTYTVEHGDTTGFSGSDTTHLATLNFLMKNDTCFRFYEFLERKHLTVILKRFSRDYKKAGTDLWIDKTGVYEAKIDHQVNGKILPDELVIIKFKKRGSIQYTLPRFPDPY